LSSGSGPHGKLSTSTPRGEGEEGNGANNGDSSDQDSTKECLYEDSDIDLDFVEKIEKDPQASVIVTDGSSTAAVSPHVSPRLEDNHTDHHDAATDTATPGSGAGKIGGGKEGSGGGEGKNGLTDLKNGEKEEKEEEEDNEWKGTDEKNRGRGDEWENLMKRFWLGNKKFCDERCKMIPNLVRDTSPPLFCVSIRFQ
jgi:hypothetical protein